jgi:hypothetical protein
MNLQTAGVTWQDARSIALKWLDDMQADPDLAKIILLPDFVNDEDCRFFFSDRSLAFHRMILKAAARDARRRGIKTVVHKITPKQYRSELRFTKQQDSAKERAHFVFRQSRPVI